MSENNQETSQKEKGTLSHVQFYQLTELIKMHRDGVAKTSCWRDAREFMSKKVREAGYEMPVSEHSVSEICKMLEITLTGKRIRASPRTDEDIQHSIHILARALARLYESLNTPLTPGLERLVALARRQTSLSKMEQEGKNGIVEE